MLSRVNNLTRKVKSFFKKEEYSETGYSDERYSDPQYLKELIDNGNIDYCLVDSRDIQDYQKDHIQSAINVPYYSIEENLPSENLFTIMIVYGYTERASVKAAEMLSELGYFNVVVFGAYSKWIKNIEKQ